MEQLLNLLLVDRHGHLMSLAAGDHIATQHNAVGMQQEGAGEEERVKVEVEEEMLEKQAEQNSDPCSSTRLVTATTSAPQSASSSASSSSSSSSSSAASSRPRPGFREGRMDASIEFSDTARPRPWREMNCNMEADMDLENGSPGAYAGTLPQLMSMDDFDMANPYTPPVPRPTTVLLKSDSRKGDFAAAFNIACQAHNIVPEFSFFPVVLHGHDVELKLDGEIIDRIGPYASHKDAKEEICKKHLSTVEAMPNRKKRKSSTDTLLPPPPGLDDERWVNILQEYTQEHQFPLPNFVDGGTHPSNGPWWCTVQFHGCPATPFGSGLGPFATKAAAKKAAAMDAVQWLRSRGMITGGQRSTKKKKKALVDTSMQLDSSGDHLTLADPSPLALRVKSTDEPSKARGPAKEGSVGQQVHSLALFLGFTQPAFRHKRLEGFFYDTYAEFNPRDVRTEPKLEDPNGQLCKVEHVFGKKAAQHECALRVLALLEEIRRCRAA